MKPLWHWSQIGNLFNLFCKIELGPLNQQASCINLHHCITCNTDTGRMDLHAYGRVGRHKTCNILYKYYICKCEMFGIECLPRRSHDAACGINPLGKGKSVLTLVSCPCTNLAWLINQPNLIKVWHDWVINQIWSKFDMIEQSTKFDQSLKWLSDQPNWIKIWHDWGTNQIWSTMFQFDQFCQFDKLDQLTKLIKLKHDWLINQIDQSFTGLVNQPRNHACVAIVN